MNKRTIQSVVIGGLVVLNLAWWTCQPIQAQEKPALDMAIFPATTYLSVKPGKSITHRVLLQYNGTQAVQITPEIHDFVANGVSGVPVIKDSTSFATITLDNPQQKLNQPFVMHPNTKLDFSLTITPSPAMVEKEYPLVFLLRAEPLPDRIGDTTGAAASGVIASNMIVWVSHDGQNRGEITMAKFPMPRFIDSFGKISVKGLAENTGETALAIKGTITLHHWQGKQLGKWFIFPDVVLAKSTRLVRGILVDPAELKEDDEPQVVPMEYDAPFLLGPYTVTTQLESPDGSTEQRTVTVFALPFSITIAILTGLGLYGGYLAVGRYVNQKRW